MDDKKAEFMAKYQECMKSFIDVTADVFDLEGMTSIHAGLFNKANGKYYKIDVAESSEEELQETVEGLRHGQ